jgi:hypothetical protein
MPCRGRAWGCKKRDGHKGLDGSAAVMLCRGLSDRRDVQALTPDTARVLLAAKQQCRAVIAETLYYAFLVPHAGPRQVILPFFSRVPA